MGANDILARIGVDSSSFQAGMRNLGNMAKSESANIAKGMIGAFGAQAIAERISQLGQQAESIISRSKAIGVSTSAMQAWGEMNEKMVGGEEAAIAGLVKFNETIGKAASGEKAAVEAFKNIGVSIEGVGGKTKSTDQLLREVMDAIRDLPGTAAKGAAAVDMFGKSGKEMVPALQEGAKALKEMEGSIKVLSNADLKNVAGMYRDMLEARTMGEVLTAKAFGTLSRWSPVGIASRMAGAFSATGSIKDAFRAIKIEKEKADEIDGSTIDKSAEIAKLVEQAAKWAKAKRDTEYESLSDTEKLLMLKREQLSIETELESSFSPDDKLGINQKLLELEEKKQQVQKQALVVEKEATEEKKKQAEEAKRSAAENKRLNKETLDALKDQQSAKDRIGDMWKYSLEDLAGQKTSWQMGGGRKAFRNPTDRDLAILDAREVKRLDELGKGPENEWARKESLSIRSQMGDWLQSGDVDPMKGLMEDLNSQTKRVADAVTTAIKVIPLVGGGKTP